MKDDGVMKSLTGGDITLLPLMGRAMLAAGIAEGEYYAATDDNRQLLGFLMTMPPGRDLFDTETQRNLGLREFMEKLSDAGKEYYQTTYMSRFPGFVAQCIGPKGKTESFWIHMVMIDHEHQRKGIAKALIGLVREKAIRIGAPVALSTTTPTNAIIYQKIGFELKGQMIMPSPWEEWPLYVFFAPLPSYSRKLFRHDYSDIV